MKKITCECCKRVGSRASWWIFGLMVCETCRLTVIEYFHDDIGFGSHVFLDEFMIVSR